MLAKDQLLLFVHCVYEYSQIQVRNVVLLLLLRFWQSVVDIRQRLRQLGLRVSCSLLFGACLWLKHYRGLSDDMFDSGDYHIFGRFQFAMALSVPPHFDRMIPLFVFVDTGKLPAFLVRL